MKIIKMIQWSIASRKNRANLLRKDGLKIGMNCEIYRDVNFGSEPYLIEIGDNVRITSGVKFCTHDGGVWTLRNMKDLKQIDLFGKIIVGNNVHIGWNTIIMPGVRVGNNCIIGCGSIVTKDIPDNSIAVGIPARVIETVDEYYQKNKNKFLNTADMEYEEKKVFVLRNLENY